MGTTTAPFAVTTPAGSDALSSGDDQIRSDKTAMDERYALEHNSLISATGSNDALATSAGRHKPGKVACTYIETYANILLLTGMVKGSLAYDTTNSRMLVYDGSSWITHIVGSSYGPALMTSIFGSAALAASGMTTVGAWYTAPSTVANLFDNNPATNWGDAILAAGNGVVCYWDLGAIYTGAIVAIGKSKTPSGNSGLWGVRHGYDSTAAVIGTIAVQYENLMRVDGNTYYSTSFVRPFWGRYVGLVFSSSSASTAPYFSIAEFEVYGRAV